MLIHLLTQQWVWPGSPAPLRQEQADPSVSDCADVDSDVLRVLERT